MEESNNADNFPPNVLQMVRLKPLFRFVDTPIKKIDSVFNLNAIMWDVLAAVQKLGTQYEITDSHRQPVNKDLYLLEYLTMHNGVIFISELQDGQPEPLPHLLSEHYQKRAMPLEDIPSSDLYLNAYDFRRELSKRMTDVGLPCRIQVFNHNFSQLPDSVPSIAEWLRSSHSEWFVLVPLRLFSSQTHAEETTTSASNDEEKNQNISIELRKGVTLDLDSEYFSMSQDGIAVTSEVTDALFEFISLYGAEASNGSKAEASEEVSSINYTDLGQRLRRAMEGSRFMAGMESLSDERVARTAIELLQSGHGPDTAMAYRLAQDYIELKHKVRELETNRVNWIPRRVNTFWQVFCLVGSRFLTLLLFLSRQDLTMVVLYSMFWLILINIIGKGMNFVKIPIGLYLVVNVFLLVLRVRWHIDAAELLASHCFPKIYPENPAVSLKMDSIKHAATQLLDGRDVNYDELVDSLVIKPTYSQVIAISIFSSIPSLLGKWHRSVNRQRQKTREAIVVAVEDEKSKLASEQEHQRQLREQPSEPIHHDVAEE